MVVRRANHSLGVVFNQLVRLEFEPERVPAVCGQLGLVFDLEHSATSNAAGLSGPYSQGEVRSSSLDGPHTRPRPALRHRVCAQNAQLRLVLFLPQVAPLAALKHS